MMAGDDVKKTDGDRVLHGDGGCAEGASRAAASSRPFGRRRFLGAAAGVVAAAVAAPVLFLSCTGAPLLKRNVKQEGNATIFPAGNEMLSGLSIAESAWLKSTSSNMMPCAFALKNEVANTGFREVAVRVVGADGKGALLIDEQITIPCVFPGETCYMGVQVGDLSQEEAESLEYIHFLVAGAEDVVVYANETPKVEVNYPYNLKAVRDGDHLRYRSCFDIALSSDKAHIDEPLLGEAILDAAYVSCIVRDLEGNLLCGYGEYVEGLKPEEPVRADFFVADNLWDRPATVAELYARPWMRDQTSFVSKRITVSEKRF